MKSNRRNKKGSKSSPRMWTLKKAQSAVPYLCSVLESLRGYHLEARSKHAAAERMAAKPGRPDRDAIIEHTEAVRAATEADERYQQTLAELEPLRVKVLDPTRGLAMLPFLHDDRLAWFIFDLFDPAHLRAWRFHRDPNSKLRPLADLARVDSWLA
jgi:hypothetical protein